MKKAWRSIAVIGLSMLPGIAAAHPGHGGGLVDGLLHPLAGVDHLLAMIAVGIWAAQLGGSATWRVPLSFVSCMLIGAGLAVGGVSLPFAEGWIAISVLAIGLLIAAHRRLPTGVGAAIAGVLAIAHGHAHGAEMAAGVSTVAYACGFVVMTALLHVAGIALVRSLTGTRASAVRWVGAGIGGVGAWLLLAAS